jgi:IS30 family transposase
MDRKPRLASDAALFDAVADFLRLGWSPEQVSGRRKRMEAGVQQPSGLSLSHEAIYTAIYALPRGELRRELISCLRHEKPARGRKPKASERRGKLCGMTNIHEWPTEIEARLVPGQWKGDLILGAGGASAIGTLVERTTRFCRAGADAHTQGRCGGLSFCRCAECHSILVAKDADIRLGKV